MEKIKSDRIKYAIRNKKIIIVEHLRKKWYKCLESGETILIADRNIFPNEISATENLTKRIVADLRQELRDEREIQKKREERDKIFAEHPELLDSDEIPFGLMTNAEIIDYIKQKENYEKNK